MTRRRLLAAVVGVVGAAAVAVVPAQRPLGTDAGAGLPGAAALTGALSAFAPDGASPGMRFTARIGRVGVALGSSGDVRLTMPDTAVLSMRLVGSAAHHVATSVLAQGVTNAYVGDDPKHWRTGIPRYTSVRYHDVYPGVDVQYRLISQGLEYDFLVAPHADPRRIGLAWSGESAVRIDDTGSLEVRIAADTVRERPPVLYQERGGDREPISGGYFQRADGTAGFRIGAYDRARPLVIDPAVDFSTYFGGSQDDDATAVGTDAAGDVIVAGNTSSPDLPTRNPVQLFGGVADVFVAKFRPTGQLVYATYLGGDGANFVSALAVDAQGNADLTGGARSRNFPAVNAYDPRWRAGFCPKDPGGRCPETFVASLDSNGHLRYSSYFGTPGSTRATALAVDGAGHAFVAGYGLTQQPLPVSPGALDSTSAGPAGVDRFLAEFDPSSTGAPSLLRATYLPIDGPGVPGAVGVNSSGAVFVAGDPLGQGVFVLELDRAVSTVMFASSLSRGGGDGSAAMAVDQTGRVYLAGWAVAHRAAQSPFPTTAGALPTPPAANTTSAFVAVIDPNAPAGQSLPYATLLGGSGADAVHALALDTSGHVWVAGDTTSRDFPLAHPVQSRLLGTSAAFVSEVDPSSGSTPLVFSTYLSGFAADHGAAIAVDRTGAVNVAGSTTSPFFPTRHALQSAQQGHDDAFVVRISSSVEPKPAVTTLNTNRGYTDRPTTLVLHGSNFIGATSVLFGSVPATVFRVESDSTVRLSTPAHSAGDVDVTVVGPGGRSTTSASTHFTFVAPPPNAGPAPPACAFLPGPGLVQPSAAPSATAAPRVCPDIPIVPDVALSPGGLTLPPVPVLGGLGAFFALLVAGAVEYSRRGRA